MLPTCLFVWFGFGFLNLSVDYSQPLESLLEGSGQHLLYKGKVNRENHNQSGLGPSQNTVYLPMAIELRDAGEGARLLSQHTMERYVFQV